MMTYPRLTSFVDLKMVVYTNASLGKINDGAGSTGAFIA